jgi:hypothetical protein
MRAATSRAAGRSGDQTEAPSPTSSALAYLDGLVDGAVADDGQGGAELFLGDERVVVVDVGHEGGGVEVAGLAGVGVAAEQDPGAGVAGGFDEVGDDVVLGLVLQRAQDVVLVQADAHGHGGGDGGEFFADGVVDVVVDVEALEGGAGLAGVDERAPEEAFGDGFGVGVGQDDAGVVAAEFEGEAFDGVGGGFDDGALPAAVEPVNMTLPMAGCSARRAPTSRSPEMTVRTPSGSSSLRTLIRARTESGVILEGLTTAVLPMRRAGAICQMVIIMGQFQGPMAPTTPMGL